MPRRSRKRRRSSLSHAFDRWRINRDLADAVAGTDAAKARWDHFGPSNRQMIVDPTKVRTWKQTANRRMHRYWGPGDYWSDFRRGGWFGRSPGMGQVMRSLGAAAGSALPAAFGGADAGRSVGADVSRWLGWGDYGSAMQTNQLMGPGDAPAVVNSLNKSGDIFISHREFVGNVQARYSPTFKESDFWDKIYDLNPNSPTFPFLRNIAKNYELYDWNGLVFQYIPLSGEYGRGDDNTLGKVILATKYDPADTAEFQTDKVMQNYDYSTAAKPSVGQLHGVETDNRQAVTGGLLHVKDDFDRDRQFLTVGDFHIATKSIPRSDGSDEEFITIGELWVSYSIRLSRAKITLEDTTDTTVGSAEHFHEVWNSNVNRWDASRVYDADVDFNENGWSTEAGTNLMRDFTFKGDSTISSGIWLVVLAIDSAQAHNGNTAVLTAPTNCQYLGSIPGDPSIKYSNSTNNPIDQVSGVSFVVKVTGPSPVANVQFTDNVTDPATTSVRITRLPDYYEADLVPIV